MTLTENVVRVTSALANIRQAILDKGGELSPNDKCETFADAIANIPTGSGEKVKAGTFTTSVNGARIELGFKAKTILVCSAFNATLAGTDLCLIDGDDYRGYIIPSGTSLAARSGETDKNSRFTVDDTGFSFKAYTTTYANRTAYYLAIG